LQEDAKTYAKYACNVANPPNPTLCNFYAGEINRLQNELAPLAETGTDSAGNTITLYPARQVLAVVVDPIWAQAGVIDVRADQLQGAGIFKAPGDTSVTVTNATPAFLQLKGITIPAVNGGVLFDGD